MWLTLKKTRGIIAKPSHERDGTMLLKEKRERTRKEAGTLIIEQYNHP